MTNEEVPLDLTGVPDNTLITGWYEKRVDAYRELNQLELISNDAINGTTTYKDAILAIKAEIPKPGETI